METDRTVTLQPVVMAIPNSLHIYQPSCFRPIKKVSEAEFLEHYADHAHIIRYAPDVWKPSRQVTAYARGLDGWYIVL